MALTQRCKGDRFCPHCGEEVRWIKLLSGSYIAVDLQPILYIPHDGREWLVEGRRRDAEILKDCRIWKAGMLKDNLRRGYRPHAWNCNR